MAATVAPASAIPGATTAVATRLAAGAGLMTSAAAALPVLFPVRPSSNTAPSMSLRTSTRHVPVSSNGKVTVERTV